GRHRSPKRSRHRPGDRCRPSRAHGRGERRPASRHGVRADAGRGRHRRPGPAGAVRPHGGRPGRRRAAGPGWAGAVPPARRGGLPDPGVRRRDEGPTSRPADALAVAPQGRRRRRAGDDRVHRCRPRRPRRRDRGDVPAYRRRLPDRRPGRQTGRPRL
ncbi:MAG: hypothetical protein AVDCRST_MAG49-606, partial [uncultured Thermomicrobiales bacterium]